MMASLTCTLIAVVLKCCIQSIAFKGGMYKGFSPDTGKKEYLRLFDFSLRLNGPRIVHCTGLHPSRFMQFVHAVCNNESVAMQCS